MSVQINQYLICGVKLDYKEYESKWANEEDKGYDRLSPYMDSAFKGIQHKDNISCIFDGMNGDYIFMGKVLAKTQDHEFFEPEMEIEFLTKLEKDLLLKVIKTIVDTDQEECKYYLFSHYR